MAAPRSALTARFSWRFALAAVLCGTAGLGCGGGEDGLSYAASAELAYRNALDEFYDEDCLVAEPAFRNVRRKFPYSRFAALAELRAADCLFEDAKFPEAIQGYRQFARYRPSHVELAYAHFRIALSHYEQIPSEWWLTPPSHERDQHYTQEAMRLLRRFLLDHPGDPQVPRAQRLAEDAVRMLAAHELYVADFYLSRERPMAAIGRLRTLVQSYPGSEFETEALHMLGETYLSVNDPARARKAFKQLVDRFPQSSEAGEARDQLASLGG